MINLVIVKNPFKTDREIKQVDYISGQSVFSYIQPEMMGTEVIISHNGHIVPEAKYKSLIPIAGDYIAVCPVIEGSGDTGKEIGRSLAIMALSIATMGVGSIVAGGAFWGAGAIGAANWGLWSWVAATGVQIAGGYLINQMFPPGQEKQTYNWSQPNPITTEGNAVPVIFGTVRMGVMAPIQTLAQHVTTNGEKQYLNLLLCGGEGPIDPITDLTINDTPVSDYDDVEYETRLGTNDQDVISNFNDTYFTQSVSYELEKNADPSTHQLNGDYEGIEVNLDLPGGLYKSERGKFKSTTVRVKLQYRLVGSPTWTYWGIYTIEGKYTHAIHRVYTKHNLPQGQYEVSVQCTYKSGDSEEYNNAIYWTSLAGIIYDDFTYPNKVLVGLKALATDQLSGGMPRIQWTQTRSNVWVWNPYTGVYEQKSANNPAWACYDIIHSCRYMKNINTGSYEYVILGVSAARIDYQAFADWAAFCDARRIYFNGVIYQTQKLWDSLKVPEQAGRGRVLMRGTRFSCISDAPSEPVQLFNISNMALDSFAEEFLGTQDRANALELTFYNIDNDYKKMTIPVYGSNYDESTAIENPTQISLDFAMTLEQAYKYGAYQLRVNQYINRMVSWNADIDAIACQVGDVVLVQHDIPRWGTGGRIASATANTVTLDQEVTLEVGINYSIMIRLQDDTLIEKTVQGVAQETTTDTFTVTEVFSSIPQEYDLFSFGEVEKVAKPFRLMSVSREGDFRCKLQGMEYIEEVYGEATDIPVIDYPQPTGEISNISVIQYLEDYNAMIGISWEPPAAFYNGARVIIDNKQVGRVESHESSFEYSVNHIPEATQITIKIEALNDVGNVIDDAIVLWTIQPKATMPPDDVIWGDSLFTDKVYLNWNPVTNYDLEGYEVRTDTNFGSDDINLVYRGKETYYTIENPVQRNYTLYIKAFSWSEKYSTNATPLTIENTIPIAPPQPIITEFFTALWIEVEPNGENDIVKYNVYVTPSDGAGNPTGVTEKIVLATAPNKITYEASPGSSFLIVVAAEDVLGEGAKSAPIEATTKHIDSPDIPDGLLEESKLSNDLSSKINTAKNNSDGYINQVIAYPTEEAGLLTELVGNDYILKYSAGDTYVGTEIETDPNGFFDLTDQNDDELVDANGDTVIIIDVQNESGNSLLGAGSPTWYGTDSQEIHLILSNAPTTDFKVLYGVKKNLSSLAVDAMLKRGVTAKQIDANVVDSIEAMRGFAWNEPVPTDKTLLGVETRVTANEGDISTNQTSISQNATDIQMNATKIQSNDNGITAAQTAISQNADEISAHASRLTTNENNISANTANIQVNSDAIQSTVAEMHSTNWSQHFSEYNSDGWMNNSIGTVNVIAESTAKNGYVLECLGGKNTWLIWDELIPFDPEALYVIKFRVRQTVDPTVGGSRVYAGLEGVAEDGITLINAHGINSQGSQHYLCANSRIITVADGWKDYTGYVKGHGTTETQTAHPDPENPGHMYNGVAYIRPLFIVNYSGGNGTAQVDYLILKQDSSESWSQITQLANEYTVKIQQHANGQDVITGFGLALENGISEFGILADRFKIYGNPDNASETATPVFALDTQTNKLYLLADLIADGTITARMVGSNEIITESANIAQAVIENASIISVEANKITTNEAKIKSAQIESIETTQLVVGDQQAQIVNPKPEGAHLWHFDRSVMSTDGIAPESGAVYTLIPDGGRFGGAVAVEEATTNLLDRTIVGSRYEEITPPEGFSRAGRITLTVDDTTTYGYTGVPTNIPAQPDTYYTVFYYARVIRGKNALASGTQIYIGSDTQGTSGVALKYIQEELDYEWKRFAVTGMTDANATVITRAVFRVQSDQSEDVEVEIADWQLEQKSFATSFVDGSRPSGILNYNYEPNNWDKFTISAWSKRNTTIEWGGIVSAWGNFYVMWLPDSFRSFRLSWKEGGEQKNITATKVGIDCTQEFVHTVVTYDKTTTTAKCYINGELIVTNNTVNMDNNASNQGFAIGTIGVGYLRYYINGLIDEVLISPEVVSGEQIAAWYSAGAPFYDNEQVIAGKRWQMDTDSIRAYNSKGEKTIELGSEQGDGYFKGTVEAGALILPVRSGAPG